MLIIQFRECRSGALHCLFCFTIWWDLQIPLRKKVLLKRNKVRFKGRQRPLPFVGVGEHGSSIRAGQGVEESSADLVLCCFTQASGGFPFLFFVDVTCIDFMTPHELVLCLKPHVQKSTFVSTSRLSSAWAVLPGGKEVAPRETLALAALLPGSVAAHRARLWAWLPSSLPSPHSKSLIRIIFVTRFANHLQLSPPVLYTQLFPWHFLLDIPSLS